MQKMLLGGGAIPGRVLLIMPFASHRSLVKALEPLGIEVVAATNCRHAWDLLRANEAVDLVITQATLADGNWCDVLKFLIDHDLDAGAVVSSPQADEHLWSEVLWRGAYDLLVEPYAQGELRQTVAGALRAVRAARRRSGQRVNVRS